MLFLREMRFQLRSWLLWMISFLLLIAAFMAVYPLFEKEALEFGKMMESLPPFMTAVIGVDMERMFTFDGFQAFTNTFLKLLLAVSGALWGLQICGRETIARMGEFLLCKPLPRWRMILQKILAGVTLILLFHLVLLGVFLAYKVKYEGGAHSWQSRLEASLLDFLLQLFFFALGGALGMSLKRIRNPIAAASGLGLGFFVLLILSRIARREWIARLTPFYYADQSRYITEGFSAADSLILLAAGIFLLAAGVLYFINKDVEA